MANILESNLALLRKRFPEAAEFALSQRSVQLSVARAQDGGVCYLVKDSASGQWRPISNPNNPLATAQLSINAMASRLSSSLSPAVVVGLSPGHLLETVYRHFESRLALFEPFRHIYVIVDSPLHLFGWLASGDRTAILSRPEVEFHLASKVSGIVDICEKDLSRSHLFIPVSELPPSRVEEIIAPLAKLFLKRESEAELWRKENELHYSSLSDEELGKLIRKEGGRKPRLMMPTHMSSTVIQFSSRDTCEIFRDAGWETRLVKIERDLPPWHLIKAIHEFKPDLFLFIDHLRTEDFDGKLYPKGMLFATWVQDSLPAINNKEAAKAWNKMAEGRKRDLIVGYVEQLLQYGYKADRLHEMPMIVNPKIFHPIELTSAQKEKYACDVCFASNRGCPSELVVERDLLPALSSCGFGRDELMAAHDALQAACRAGRRFIDYKQLETLLLEVPSFARVYGGLSQESKDYAVQRVFWLLNDLLYRYVVLEWLDDYASAHPAFKLNLYGREWDAHPRFKKYARGVVAHGPELNVVLNAAKICLHLNAMEGQHQRLLEILSSGAVPATRSALRRCEKDVAMAFMARDDFHGGDDIPSALRGPLCEDFFSALSLALMQLPRNGAARYPETLRALSKSMPQNPGVSGAFLFNSKDELFKILDEIDSLKPLEMACRAIDPCALMSETVFSFLTGSERVSLKKPGGWLFDAGVSLALFFEGRNEEALAQARSVEAANGLNDVLALSGWSLFAKEWRFEDALALFEAEAAEGRLSDAMLGKRLFLLAANGRVEEADLIVRKRDLSGEAFAEAQRRIGKGLLHRASPSQALERFKKAAGASFRSADDACDGALVFLANGQLSDALDVLAPFDVELGSVLENLSMQIRAGNCPSPDKTGLLNALTSSGSSRRRNDFEREFIAASLAEAGMIDESLKWLREVCAASPETSLWRRMSVALAAWRLGLRMPGLFKPDSDFEGLKMEHELVAAAALCALEGWDSQCASSLAALASLNSPFLKARGNPHVGVLLLFCGVAAARLGQREFSDKCRQRALSLSPFSKHWEPLFKELRPGEASAEPFFQKAWLEEAGLGADYAETFSLKKEARSKCGC